MAQLNMYQYNMLISWYNTYCIYRESLAGLNFCGFKPMKYFVGKLSQWFVQEHCIVMLMIIIIIKEAIIFQNYKNCETLAQQSFPCIRYVFYKIQHVWHVGSHMIIKMY